MKKHVISLMTWHRKILLIRIFQRYLAVSYTHLAKKTGLEVDTVILSPMSHAGYYPGGKVMTMKVI